MKRSNRATACSSSAGCAIRAESPASTRSSAICASNSFSNGLGASCSARISQSRSPGDSGASITDGAFCRALDTSTSSRSGNSSSRRRRPATSDNTVMPTWTTSPRCDTARPGADATRNVRQSSSAGHCNASIAGPNTASASTSRPCGVSTRCSGPSAPLAASRACVESIAAVGSNWRNSNRTTPMSSLRFSDSATSSRSARRQPRTCSLMSSGPPAASASIERVRTYEGRRRDCRCETRSCNAAMKPSCAASTGFSSRCSSTGASADATRRTRRPKPSAKIVGDCDIRIDPLPSLQSPHHRHAGPGLAQGQAIPCDGGRAGGGGLTAPAGGPLRDWPIDYNCVIDAAQNSNRGDRTGCYTALDSRACAGWRVSAHSP